MKKMQDKVDKCLRDVESSKDKYENALLDLNNYNAKYMEDMTEVCMIKLTLSILVLGISH